MKAEHNDGAPTTIDLMETLQKSLAKGKRKKQRKRDPWRCAYCGDELLIKDNCRKAECLEKYEAARRRMGLSTRGAR